MTPSPPEDIVDDYLSTVDAEAPGLVEGLYLVGSVALGDYRPGRSDIDFVAVTADRLDSAGAAALSRAQARFNRSHRRPYVDGPYLTWRDLAKPPDQTGPVPYVHRRRFVPAGGFELNPVTWHTLAGHGIPRRGPAPDALDVWTDRAMLAGWTRENLHTYWPRWRDRSARLWSRPGLVSLGSWATQWGVMGVARQHCAIATGDIISKTAAGYYALKAFDERWHRIARESLRLREGCGGRSGYRTPLSRRRDLFAFISMVIDTA
ncbi:MAG TPA: nucleotidyltransferase domain-containing protein [Micromonosporaceae bacterium]|jgi:hypothetical protein|nr:nucleotidyltransferase domain-containing protein [Micromonosporaceae bacterium]